jgi:hypothetical protein
MPVNFRLPDRSSLDMRAPSAAAATRLKVTDRYTGERLARYADPEAVNSRWRPRPMSPASAAANYAALIKGAWAHNIIPAVARNLEQAIRREPQSVVSGDGEPANAIRARFLVDAKRVHVELVGRNMFIAGAARQILDETGKTSLPAVLVKGPDFAEACYGSLALRAFSDIDLLVRPDAASDLQDILIRQGFVAIVPNTKRMDYSERRFTRLEPNIGTVLVEIHTDLAHAPKLQRHCSLTYDRYAGSASGGVTMAARLILAGVHGATSHRFDRLQYVADVLAIVRRGLNQVELGERVRETGSLLPVATALGLAARIFDCPACSELAASLPVTRNVRLARRLITPGIVLAAQGPGRSLNSWRRQLFRLLMTR